MRGGKPSAISSQHSALSIMFESGSLVDVPQGSKVQQLIRKSFWNSFLCVLRDLCGKSVWLIADCWLLPSKPPPRPVAASSTADAPTTTDPDICARTPQSLS